ncbi:hypothetical protein BV25DRAFT_1916891 [Artomyces pyxidatus]|uniref:Uncharacterized protein n=1 Tax=Artomyces pyxidatus TaxID=48021 RepID=A0ACB8T087_9AGAM|nr:hypothetical protein BV25DRAFT_1916891 [Artomyces pyxidatus]
MTSIGIVFPEYPPTHGKVNALCETPNFRDTGDALVFTYTDLASPGAQQLTCRRGDIHDLALREQFVGVLHVGDTPVRRAALAARAEQPERRVTDNRLWLVRALLELRRDQLIPSTGWSTQAEVRKGVAQSAEGDAGPAWGVVPCDSREQLLK